MELPELTDEFVAKFGPNTKTVADLRAENPVKISERELKNALVSRVKQQVINGLIEQNPIDVPYFYGFLHVNLPQFWCLDQI